MRSLILAICCGVFLGVYLSEPHYVDDKMTPEEWRTAWDNLSNDEKERYWELYLDKDR